MSARRFRPARAVAVRAGPDGAPAALRWRGRAERVARVAESWDVVAGGWLGAAAARRRYYRLVTRGGLRCLVYRDLGSGRWYLDALLD
ncbi:MAG TPA: DUF6504 family protein [Thermomicrobiales bacterium]|nr:DUF6504 family protein [Thermomicrobiales bacterium]